MPLTKIHKSIYQAVLVGWVQSLIKMGSKITTNTRLLGMLYVTKSDSNVQTVYQACQRIGCQDYLLKFSLRSPMGGYHRE